MRHGLRKWLHFPLKATRSRPCSTLEALPIEKGDYFSTPDLKAAKRASNQDLRSSHLDLGTRIILGYPCWSKHQGLDWAKGGLTPPTWQSSSSHDLPLTDSQIRTTKYEGAQSSPQTRTLLTVRVLPTKRPLNTSSGGPPSHKPHSPSREGSSEAAAHVSQHTYRGKNKQQIHAIDLNLALPMTFPETI